MIFVWIGGILAILAAMMVFGAILGRLEYSNPMKGTRHEENSPP